MASVRMTIALKEQIIDAYRKQCQTAYNAEHDVDKTINIVTSKILEEAGPQFQQLVNVAEDFGKRMIDHDARYKSQYSQSQYGYSYTGGSINALGNAAENCVPIRKTYELYMICNPARPITDNLSTIADWRVGYESKWSEKWEEPSDNFIEGDMAYLHNFGDQAIYLPFVTSGDEVNYQAKEDYAPAVNLGVIISDPEMCKVLQEIPKAKKKASDMVEKFKLFIDPITTLKKFLDEFPGGKALVPADSMQAMAAPAAKRVAKATVNADELLTPDLKQEFNEVMLESTLLGDNK